MRLLLCFVIFYQFCSAQNNVSKDVYFQFLDYGFYRCDSLQLQDYCKALTYFKKGAVDSCYIVSQRLLIENKVSKNDKDVLYYLSGASVLEKGLNRKALNDFKQISKDFRFTHLLNFKYGLIYLELEEYNKTILIYEEWLKKNPEGKNIPELKAVYHNLAASYILKKDYKQAEKYFYKRFLFALKEKDTLSIVRVENELGNLFYVQRKNHIAALHFRKAYKLAKNYTNLELRQNTAKNMAVVEKNRKHYKESVHYYTEFVKWKDSVWNRDRISQLLEKDKKIALVTKDKEIAVQKQVALKQKVRVRLSTSILVIVLLFLGILFYLYKSKIKQNILINRQKEELEKLNTTKNYLLSVISHDLRSPVNTIKRNHNELNELLKTNQIKEALQLNEKSISVSKSTSQILNNILNWALQQNKQLLFIPELHPIGYLVDSILFDFLSIAEAKNITISTSLENPNTNVYIDKELFKIIFRNLIDNAIKYTPEGGEINITSTGNHNFCTLKISDTGIGMSKEMLDYINTYEMLTVEKIDRSKGLGLGLILSKTLILKNKGTFEIRNNANKGITITIQFPVKES